MSQLSQAVQEAIQKDLPGLAAGELKTFIAKAEQTEKELTEARALLVIRNKTIAEQTVQLEQHKALNERQAELNKYSSELQQKELALLKREAVLEAKIATAELNGVKETMDAFLKNTTVRKTVIADVSKPVDGMPSSQYASGSAGTLQRNYDGRPDTTTTTETEE